VYSGNSGLADTGSTWGTDRAIEDWTYAFQDPDPQVLKIGPLNGWRLILTSTNIVQDPTNTPDPNKKPSSTITWTHKAQQMGPTITDAQSNFTITHSNDVNGTWTGSTTSNTILNKMTNFAKNRAPDAAPVTISDNDSKKILQTDVGSNLCSKVTASPGGGGNFSTANRTSNDNSVNGTPTCVYIPYNYQLKPNTDIASPGKNGDAGTTNYDDPAIFQAKIPNDGPTKSKPVDWEAFIFIIPNTESRTNIPSAKWNSSYTATLTAANAPAYLKNVYGPTAEAPNGLTKDIRNYQVIGTRTNSGRCTTHNATHDAKSWPNNDNRVFYPARPTSNTDDPDTTDNNIVCQTNDLIDIINTLDLGDRLCFALWVSPSYATPADQSPTNNRSYSQPSCLTVSKSPQLQLRGADSKSGATSFGQTSLLTNPNSPSSLPNQFQGGFAGSTSSNPLRGSWSQYGLLATGTGQITSFGSTGYTANTNNAPKFCKLLFANTDKDSSNITSRDCTGTTPEAAAYGQLNMLASNGTGRTVTLPKVAEQDKATLESQHQAITLPGSSTRSLNDLPSGTYYITTDTVITTSTLAADQHLVLVVPTNTSPSRSITITGNITAGNAAGNATYTTLDAIPTLTIIADHIYIDGNVTSLFGTYIAKERFNTCVNPTLSKTPGFNQNETLAGIGETTGSKAAWSGKCKQQLTINGAVVSKLRPSFQRTAGAGKDDTTTPAEILNYTPNNYLTPYTLSQTGNSNNWTLADFRQLPGRL
jgi:hypothetical protein